MQYIPNLNLKDKMLEEMSLKSIEDLFADIPQEVRIPRLDLPDGETEMEVLREIKDILKRNKTFSNMPSFLGGGIYNHYIPSAVRAIVSRSEFYTSYTPYQPEISQGMLQALFEYQSMIAELTGLEVANSSMYDSATALGEAALMASRIHKGREFLIPRNIHPDKKSVLKNYTKGLGIVIKEVDYDQKSGMLDLTSLKENLNDETCGVYVENPNFFGVIDEGITKVREIIGDVVFVLGVNPLSLGLLKSPRELGADIAIGEGQALGNPMCYGGPLLGIFACAEKHMRYMPGRIVGLTKDSDGKRAFCLTLQTREQHIRRAKATSNICSNEAICALAGTVYLSLLGKGGLEQLGKILISKGRMLARRINNIEGYEAPIFKSYHFNEFVMRSDIYTKTLHLMLLNQGINGGIKLKPYFPELGESTLVSVTEVTTDEDMNAFLDALEYARGV